MKKLPLLAAGIVVGVCLSMYAPDANADEINYGSLKDQYGDTLVLEYKSPAGAQYATCSLPAGTCKKRGTTTPDLFPALLGTKQYVRSADGRLGVKPFSVGATGYYFLYDLTSKTPTQKALIPYTTPGATVYVSKNNDAVVFRNGKQFTRYDIKTKQLATVNLHQDLAFLALSPSATYVTGYNYGTQLHELWRFADGKKIDGPSAMQSYLEFSEDETRIAYLDDVEGFRTLFTMKSSELGKPTPNTKQLTKPKTETEDYLFVGSTLYFMANVDGPLEWDLFSYDGTKTRTVDTDVSYGDFLKRVRSSAGTYLAYLKTTGKNTDIVLVQPNPSKPQALNPIKASPASDDVTRTVVSYGKRTGVLLAPDSGSTKSRDLFIWMHGGPQRQVAKSYHPYLSYAVYDELLERLAAGGNYVYKIDYTGSTGYGAAFRKALDMQIGDVEIKDIKNAITAIKKDKRIDRVFLIGNSYGGYMALRGVVDMPELVDGVISINGVSDWYGLIQQIPSSPFRELFNGVPDTTNLDAYFKASVFTGMEKLTSKDKVLVVWGEQDSTVPVWQSTKYVDFAESQGVNVSTLSFSTEDHIIRERTNLDALCTKVTKVMSITGVSCSL